MMIPGVSKETQKSFAGILGWLFCVYCCLTKVLIFGSYNHILVFQLFVAGS